VIVHDRLRKRGLGSILVYKAFLDVVTDSGLEIAKIYTHAVHPATVRMLSRLLFSKPPLLGPPYAMSISAAPTGNGSSPFARKE
jgi:hypothetical protein